MVTSMRLVYLICGDNAFSPTPDQLDRLNVSTAEVLHLSDIPSRVELRAVDDIAKEVLPVDPTPSLDEIAAQPDVDHLGQPQPPPQKPEQQLRIVVAGTDAALGAVLTRMMRGDYLWAEVGYVPVDGHSAAAINWDLPGDGEAACELATRGRPRPVPVIRNDAGMVVAGSASVTAADGGAFEGEIIVDDRTLVQQRRRPEQARFFGQFGARLVPTTAAPGIAAVRLTTSPVEQPASPGWRARLADRIVRSIGLPQAQTWLETPSLAWLVSKASAPSGGADPRSLLSGRALQCGGNEMLVTVDGVPGRRPLDRVTFYRHLRDLQIVRQ